MGWLCNLPWCQLKYSTSEILTFSTSDPRCASSISSFNRLTAVPSNTILKGVGYALLQITNDFIRSHFTYRLWFSKFSLIQCHQSRQPQSHVFTFFSVCSFVDTWLFGAFGNARRCRSFCFSAAAICSAGGLQPEPSSMALLQLGIGCIRIYLNIIRLFDYS